MKDNTPLNKKDSILPFGDYGATSIRIPRLKASKQTWRRFFKMFPNIIHHINGDYKLKNMDKTTEDTVKDFFHARERLTVYMMIGIPGSGKSTWVAQHCPDLPIVSRDNIRLELGIAHEGEKISGTREQEKHVTAVENRKIEEYCKAHQSFVIDDMNINPYHRKAFVEMLHKYNAYVIGVNVNTPVHICIERRKGQIPKNVMQRIAKSVCPLEESEVDYIINVNYEE